MFDCEIQFHLKFHTNGLKVKLTTDLLKYILQESFIPFSMIAIPTANFTSSIGHH